MASGSGTNVKYKKKSKDSVASVYSELEALLKKRNKLLHPDEDNLEANSDHEHDDVDLTKVLQTVPKGKPNKRLQRNEDAIKSLVIDVNKVKQASGVEKNFDVELDDENQLDDEIGEMLANLRKVTANVFKKILSVQDSFNECLTNNVIVLPNDIKEKTIKMHTQIVEQTCALHRGIESVNHCAKETLQEHVDEDLYVETPDEFKKVCSKLERGIISQTYEDGVKTSKNHEHLLATQRYNKHSDELSLDIAGERIDPYTKKPITKPVINTICKHVYDQESIELMFRGNSFIRCPYIGCSNKHTTKNNLKMMSDPEDI